MNPETNPEYRHLIPEWVKSLQSDDSRGWLCAEEIYREVWDVDRIIEVCNIDGLHDYSKMDKLVVLEDGRAIRIAQRFRKSRNGKIDFTLTTSQEGSEREHFIEAVRNDVSNHPRLYAFGIAKAEDSQNTAEEGFAMFYLVNMDVLVSELVDTQLEDGPFFGRNKKQFTVYQWPDIRKAGAIEREWSVTELQGNVSGGNKWGA